ncbi:MAG: hypothetical protein LBT43_01605 [Prevotella sp.]|jgi:hypothetical protein|nr:hypothetical protein [Prevotella sp.]
MKIDNIQKFAIQPKADQGTGTETGDYGYKYPFTNVGLEQYTNERDCLHAGTTLFCRALYQGKQATIGYGPISDLQVDVPASSDCTQFFVSAFVLKEKLLWSGDLPLLSVRDIKRWIVFKLYRQISENDLADQIFDRHCRRQKAINIASDKQILIC